MTEEGRIKKLADKQSEWTALPLQTKTKLIKDVLSTLSATAMETMIEKMGNQDATMKGFSLSTAEGKFEATESASLYAIIVHSALSRLLTAYQNNNGDKLKLSTTPVTKEDTLAVQTFPMNSADKFGPFAKATSHVWVTKAQKEQAPFPVEATLKAKETPGIMVVLGAGNQLFLSAVDCLNGLFVENSVVFLKHHPLRGHHDGILRHILKPLIERGYFDSEVDSGLERTKEIIYHPSVSRVHLTGGKAAHDAIVWGPSGKRSKPILKAQMTSELGCVTPWIVAPQSFSEKELDHQTKHLFMTMYSNAGANCNCPKLVILTKDWPQAETFVAKLKSEMKKSPVPVAYYPGSSERWNGYRKAYPKAFEIGDTSTSSERKLSSEATLLPWLVIDSIDVDLKSQKGRESAAVEYAFRNEPFAPVVTIARVDSLEDAVTLANDYVYGSLSCTVVASQSAATDVEQAITDLKYGVVAVNVWSALGYAPTLGCVWGAYPGETIENVESGIGFVNNFCFLEGAQKAVLRTNVVDAVQSTRNSNNTAAGNELRAVARLTLQPGVFTLVNLIVVTTTGFEIPSVCDVYNTLIGMVGKPLNLLRQ